MSIWSDFKRLDSLSIAFRDNYSAKNADIFGNSRHQVAVVIQVKMTGNDNQAMVFPDNELLKCVSLVNYATGNTISKPWSMSENDNGYSTAFQYSSVSDPVENNESNYDARQNSLVLYISSSAFSQNDIAAQITIPGVGSFNTSANGTSTLNGPSGGTGSVFKAPSYVHVNSLIPVDYSDGIENINISGMPTSFDKLSHKVTNVYIYENGKDHYNGTASNAEVIITSKIKNAIFDKIVSTAKVKQDWNFKSANNKADAVFGVNGDNYDTIFLFVNSETFGFTQHSSIYIDNKNGRYRKYMVGSNYDRFNWRTPIPSGKLKINICNHRIPDIYGKLWQLGWYDEPTQSVELTDSFGNKSTIVLNCTSGSWPGFTINGVSLK